MLEDALERNFSFSHFVIVFLSKTIFVHFIFLTEFFILLFIMNQNTRNRNEKYLILFERNTFTLGTILIKSKKNNNSLRIFY